MHFGFEVQKIAVDGGFTCPNRDGTKGWGGCTYCNNAAFSPAAGSPLPVQEQVIRGISRFERRGRTRGFLVYFQPYSNTYGKSLGELKALYDAALDHPKVVGLAVGTRPDCISAAILTLLSSYAKKGKQVWIEYGLQSVHNRTLEQIHRGHTFEQYCRAVAATQGSGILICTHIILGLPGESHSDMMATVRFLSTQGVHGIKMHHLHILRNTPMAEEYLRGRIRLFEEEEYVRLAADVLENLPPSMVIQRICGEAPREMVLAPAWTLKARQIPQLVSRELERRGREQGSAFPG